jgi:hypothetical protein
MPRLQQITKEEMELLVNINIYRVCNNSHGYKIHAVIEASQEGSFVSGISVNMLARKRYKSYLATSPVPGQSGWFTYRWGGYNWEREKYFIGSSGRFFGFETYRFAKDLDPAYDVVFGSQIYLKNGVVVHDLGGLINLGRIPENTCRTFDDGRFY